MPKRPSRNKQTARSGSRPRTAGDLISARLPALLERARSAAEASEWHVTVMNALGNDLVNKVNRVSLESGRITVTADSAAWAARIRFVLAEAEPQLHARLAAISPGFRELVVRVRPRKSDLP
jgi:hypothetical protein